VREIESRLARGMALAPHSLLATPDLGDEQAREAAAALAAQGRLDEDTLLGAVQRGEARFAAALLARLPDEIEREARITHGLPSQTVMAVGDLVAADLVVMATHGESNEEHTSVTELLLEHSQRSLLVLHERDVESGAPGFLSASPAPHVVLVPTDLAAGSRAAEELAVDLVGRVPSELHLLHVPEKGRRGEPAADELEREMRARVPEALAERVSFDVVKGPKGLQAANIRAAD